jgi:hypothetical protein
MAAAGGGWAPAGYGHLRASQADRERAVDVLKAAFAEGRLDQDEYADRVGALYSSRTYAEIGALTADLPIGPMGMLAPQPFQTAVQLVPPVPYPPAAPLPSPVNEMSVASLCFGLGSFLTAGVTAIPALLLGAAGLVRAYRTGERGAWMAVIGLLLGGAGLWLIPTVLLGH